MFSNINYSRTIVLRVDVLAILQVHVRLDWMRMGLKGMDGLTSISLNWRPSRSCEAESLDSLGDNHHLNRMVAIARLGNKGELWISELEEKAAHWSRDEGSSTRDRIRYFSPRGKEGAVIEALLGFPFKA